MVEWQQRQLGECLKLISGGTPSKARNDYWGGDIPWVSCKDMKVERIYDAEDHLTQLGAENGTRLVPDNTILFVVRGMILAREFPVAMTKRTVAFNQDLKAVMPADFINTEFLFHWFRANTHEILGRADEAGHGTKRLQTDRLLALPIHVPPPPEQVRIAGILSAYDELIENSQRRIRILESMARAIYREWFVHFRFPGHENHRRVASSLGEIPKGWEVASLAELCSRMESGGTPRRKNVEYWDGGDIDWYKTGELWDGFLFDSQEKITAIGQRNSTARLFEPGTILMAIYGSPTVGRMGILTRNASCNQAALGLVADRKRISQTFLYFVLLSLRDHFNGLAQGAAQQNISKEKVAGTLAVVPPCSLVVAFDKLAEPFFGQIESLQRQVQNLRRTRDLLLPRLLSGEIDLETAA
jgi:type I restriction enzyme S subunit